MGKNVPSLAKLGIIMLLSLSPTRTGAQSSRNVHRSKLSAVASARSARSSQSASLKSIITAKSVRQKALPSFLRDTRSLPASGLHLPQARLLLPIEELLGDGETRVPGEELRRALDRGIYRDEEVVLRAADMDLHGKDLKPVARREEFPIKVVETVFRIIQQSANSARTFAFTVSEAAEVLGGLGVPRSLQDYE